MNSSAASAGQDVFNNLMIAQNILGNIQRGSRKLFRLVNLTWNEAYLSKPKFYKNGISINGEADSSKNRPPFALKQLVVMLSNQKESKKVHWTTLNVLNMNMENVLVLHDVLHFKMLADRLFSNVVSLHLSKVKLTPERFVDIVIVSGNLVKIRIANSPSIFKAGFKMSENYQNAAFRSRMSNLKSFKITQGGILLDDQALLFSNDILTTMADSFTNLEVFELYLSDPQCVVLRSSVQFLPEKTIGKILFNNRSTLRKLALGGNFDLGHPLMVTLARSNMNLALKQLFITGCTEKTGEFLMNFLFNLDHKTLENLTLGKFPLIGDDILLAVAKYFVNLKAIKVYQIPVSKIAVNCLIDHKISGDLPKLQAINLKGCNQINYSPEQHRNLVQMCRHNFGIRLDIDKTPYPEINSPGPSSKSPGYSGDVCGYGDAQKYGETSSKNDQSPAKIIGPWFPDPFPRNDESPSYIS